MPIRQGLLPMFALPLLLLGACGPSEEPRIAETSAPQDQSRPAGDGRTIDPTTIAIPTPLGKSPSTGPATAAPEIADEAAMARAILANPVTHKPETYVYVTKYLWERGDRQQAAFWHFLFQIRTLPWLEHDRQLGPFRSGVNASIGATINEWLGSDYDAWLDTTRRAMSYERRLPLSPQKPVGVSDAVWAQAVARGRATWGADFRQLTGSHGPTRAAIEAQRRANGRYVGPLQQPGAALPADWR